MSDSDGYAQTAEGGGRSKQGDIIRKEGVNLIKMNKIGNLFIYLLFVRKELFCRSSVSYNKQYFNTYITSEAGQLCALNHCSLNTVLL